MKNSEEIFLFVWDEDLPTIEIFVRLRCAANLGIPEYRENLRLLRKVSAHVGQYKIRVPSELKSEILKLGESFLARHQIIKSA